MTGKILFHIGLPKTATTTLQSAFFPALVSETTDYLGVLQPRDERQQSDLYESLFTAAVTGQGIEELHKALVLKLGSGKTLIVSEEGFTVSTGAISWQDKLCILSQILQGLDYELILTVREPVSAMFSYYVELFPYFSKRCASFEECALKDTDMHIYHYKKLTDEIFRYFDRDRVHAIKYEDIIANDLSKLTQILPMDARNDYVDSLPNRNKKKHDNHFVYTRHELTLKSILNRTLEWLGISDMKPVVWLKRLAKPVTSRIDSFVIKRKKVASPTREEIDKLRITLSTETSALNNVFGIIYE